MNAPWSKTDYLKVYVDEDGVIEVDQRRRKVRRVVSSGRKPRTYRPVSMNPDTAPVTTEAPKKKAPASIIVPGRIYLMRSGYGRLVDRVEDGVVHWTLVGAAPKHAKKSGSTKEGHFVRHVK